MTLKALAAALTLTLFTGVAHAAPPIIEEAKAAYIPDLRNNNSRFGTAYP